MELNLETIKSEEVSCMDSINTEGITVSVNASSSTSFMTTNSGSRRKRKRSAEDVQPLSDESYPFKNEDKKSKIFIAVHLGAGNHSSRKKDVYMALCNSACEKALSLLRNGESADEAVLAATMILESSGSVNSGKGSNLTLDKTVECDAGFMNGSGLFGGVGAVSGVPNPILIAKKIAELQGKERKLSCGRVPPNFLVGQGAKAWAETQSIPVCKDEELVSKKAAKTYTQFMSKIENQEAMPIIPNEDVTDTVGAIALDKSGKVAATVSSGGNWLKFPGRIGHSPQFGSGCWASNKIQDQDNSSSIAVSTTGVGEMLSKIHWASECHVALQDQKFGTPVEAISHTIKDKFLNSHLLKHHTESKIVGVIALIWDGNEGEFVWGHTSQSMIVGYGGTDFKRVKMKFSSLPTNSKVLETMKVEGIRL